MNTCHICDRTALNGPKPHSIRMPRMAFDQKLAYVESVCDVLLESRFGPGYSYSYLDKPDYNAADASFSFIDLIEQEFSPSYAESQNRLRKWAAITRWSSNAPETVGQHAGAKFPLGRPPTAGHFAPTLARGSPKPPGRPSYFASSFANLASLASLA